jgi:hypothetical protein
MLLACVAYIANIAVATAKKKSPEPQNRTEADVEIKAWPQNCDNSVLNAMLFKPDDR